ncbi:MAG: hypothetical protein AAGA72_09230 [Pseudomonadota bacterium]
MSGLNSIRHWLLIASTAFSFAASNASAQEVIWDQQVRVGPLVAFPSVRDEDVYYYASTSARLARDGGLPKFSFVRFSEEDTSGGEAALGGGVVHAVVELGASETQVEEAREALREINGQAELRGPVAFKDGHFTLVSSMVGDEEDGVSRRVVGMGKAPLLEGNRAAVSMLLTARGANILWSTFNTATPDISFSFDMMVDAYRSPISAVIEADWDKVYSHENFEAAFRLGVDSAAAQVMMGGEISATYDDLAQTEAINITIIGDDESVTRATEAAYEELREVMFEPANMAGDTNFTPQQEESAYERATEMFNKAEENRQRRNDRARQDRERAINAQSQAAGSSARLQVDSARTERLRAQAKALEAAAQEAETQLRALSQDENASEAQRAEAQRVLAQRRAAAQAARQAADAAIRAANSAEANDADIAEEAAREAREADLREDDLNWEQGTQTTVSAYVGYRMKRVKQTGSFRQDMSKYTPQVFSLRFDENIGDMRRYLDDERVFSEQALDQIVFSQRQIFVETNEIDVADFSSHLNSVSVELRKTHENGDVSYDDVVIRQSSFDDAEFRLTYLSDGDRDPARFAEYEYKVDWNFAGGVRVPGAWVTQTGPVIPLTPPMIEQDVNIRLDQRFAINEDVAGVAVRLFSERAGRSVRGPVVRLNPEEDGGFGATSQVVVSSEDPMFGYSVDVAYFDGRSEIGEKRQTQNTFLIINGE